MDVFTKLEFYETGADSKMSMVVDLAIFPYY